MRLTAREKRQFIRLFNKLKVEIIDDTDIRGEQRLGIGDYSWQGDRFIIQACPHEDSYPEEYDE